MKGDEKMNQGIKKILVSLLAFCLLTTPVFSVSTAAVTAKYSKLLIHFGGGYEIEEHI